MSRDKISYYLIFTGLLLLVGSLPLSRFGMSVSQIFLGLGWIINGRFDEKIKKFFNCRSAVLLASVYLLHVLGVLWSTDLDYALKDLRIKLPLLILPFILASVKPLTKEHFQWVLGTGVLAVFAGSMISMAVYQGFGNDEFTDIRNISVFISHIRFALLICVSVISSAWLSFQFWHNRSRLMSYLLILMSIWLTVFLFILESLTGLFILGVVFVALIIYQVIKMRNTTITITATIIIVVGCVCLVNYFSTLYGNISNKETLVFDEIEMITSNGNKYYHVKEANTYENGTYIWAYICDVELESGWSARSDLKLHDEDKKGQKLRTTLIRYMSSKGLRKDSTGLVQLTEEDIHCIENGVANYLYNEKNPIEARLMQVVWEIHDYINDGNPSGHSFAQRFEYWKTSIAIIKDHPIIGVGTGDVPSAFVDKYNETESYLTSEWRLRAHNQYLSIGVGFGLVGFLWFILALFHPVIAMIRKRSFLFITFFMIASISMLTEDTLETQAGVTFFTLFTCLYLFVNPNKSSC